VRSKASAIAIADNFFICPPSFLKFKWTNLQQKLRKNGNIGKLRLYLMLSLKLLKRLQAWGSLREPARRKET
jgi:hypothetical protein